MWLNWVSRVTQGFNQELGQDWVLISGSTKQGSTSRLTQVAGNLQSFPCNSGTVTATISCWLSVRGHPQLLHVSHSCFVLFLKIMVLLIQKLTVWNEVHI